jgi:RNA polymerase primary sigma factor
MLTTPHARTRPMGGSLDSYLRDVHDEPTLNAEEERELAERVLEGDIEAREQLARANLRLVVTIARQYTARKIGLDDLIEEGNLGLLRAVETFDPSRGTRFSTYAAYWIRQSIRRGLMSLEATIRLPYYTMQMFFEWRRTSERLLCDLGRQPSENEVAAELGWKPRQVDIIRRVLNVIKGNNRAESQGNATPLDELIDAREAPVGYFADLKPDMVSHVLKLVKSLPERDAQVLRLRYGLDGGRTHTLQEVGDLLGLTKARICQIEKGALRKLREELQADGSLPLSQPA